METKERRISSALILSFILPGLGQVYNGQLKKGIVFLLLPPSIGITLTIFGLIPFVIAGILSIAFFVLILWDSVKQAKIVKKIDLKRYNKWYYYLLIFILFLLVDVFIFEDLKRYKSYRIPTGAMIATIIPGDYVVMDKFAYDFTIPITQSKTKYSDIERGDIVVFPNPIDPEIDYLKRVVAIGGDVLEIQGDLVSINGQIENASYAYFNQNILPVDNKIKNTIPAGKLWVMGDNRRNSFDSRHYGVIDESSIKGKIEVIYWSHDPTKNLFNGYSFHRIGKLLE